jgi:hypothetical protein
VKTFLPEIVDIGYTGCGSLAEFKKAVERID